MTCENPRSANGPFIDRGEPLPRSYAENVVVAMACDPERLFVYWDIDTEARIAAWPLVLRMHLLSEGRSFDTDIGPEADSWWFQVASNRTYQAELLAREDGGGLRLLAASAEVTTPVRWSGESGAELPAEAIHASRHPLARHRRRVGLERPAPHVAAAGATPVAVPMSPESRPRPASPRSGAVDERADAT